MDVLYGEGFIKAVRDYIPTAEPVAGRTELLLRCRFCGDSHDPSHAHLYISVPRSNTDLSFYHCKKCPAHGIVDDEFLRKYEVLDSNMLIAINKHNAEVMNTPKYKRLRKIDKYNLYNRYVRKDPNNKYKIDYINNRIGSNFTLEQMINLKIALNLYDILNSNSLELTRHKSITDSLDKYFIGFISYDNAFINMRKTTDKELYKSINKRYINYDLVSKTDDNKNYYVIPTQIDLSNPTPIKIHIAEGPFDILSIYYNLNGCNNYQNIYASCNGKGYLNTLEFILKETGVINFEFHYYPDNSKDVTNREINIINNTVSKLNCPVFMHRNSFKGEKDYGVPKNKIIDNVFRIF